MARLQQPNKHVFNGGAPRTMFIRLFKTALQIRFRINFNFKLLINKLNLWRGCNSLTNMFLIAEPMRHVYKAVQNRAANRIPNKNSPIKF